MCLRLEQALVYSMCRLTSIGPVFGARPGAVSPCPVVTRLHCLLITLLLICPCLAQPLKVPDEGIEIRELGLMLEVQRLITEHYLGEVNVDVWDLISRPGELRRDLDPFSGFLTPKQLQSLQEYHHGGFGGLGIVIRMQPTGLHVVRPLPDSPAERAGLRPGDRITSIEVEPTKGETLRDAVVKLRGDPGTKVRLEILRPGEDEPRTITVKRSRVGIPSVTNIGVLSGVVGYLRIRRFGERTADEVDEALKALATAGAQALILDLRANPGGLLQAAIAVSARFLPPNTLVTTTERKGGTKQHEFRTPRSATPTSLPMLTLVDASSASAAEVVAGCLQDWERSLLLGQPTFGKGSLQDLVSLPDGRAIRLTTAQYKTPKGRVIHQRGLIPDMVVTLSDWDLVDLVGPAAPLTQASAKAPPSRDSQVQRAIDELKRGLSAGPQE